VIYDGMTSLDFVGVYDPVTRLKTMGFWPELTWDLCSFTESVSDTTNLKFAPNKVAKSLGDYDMVVVPGGRGADVLIHDEAFIEWLRTASSSKLKVSVCSGSLLLGAAGFLKGKKATTHPSDFNELKKFC